MNLQNQHRNTTAPIWEINSNYQPTKNTNDARAEKRDYNRKRGLGVSRKVKQNQIMRNELCDWWQTNWKKIDSTALEYISKYRRALSTCCTKSLFREHHNNSALEYIGAHTCNHKYCNVCNAERSKNTRRLYRNFFEKYPELIKQYDFMHLTLTVPHDKDGWNGQKFYAQELMKQFNWMRKKKWWQKMVYAGEFGVELTKSENGLHIHIHSMILVHKSEQNRNKLHQKILLAWNKQTANAETKQALTKEQQEAILKSNKLLTESDTKKMCRSGATLIGLESLYIKSKTKKKGFFKCERSGIYKKYVKGSDDFDFFMGGVMECIKYHFEPMAMKENGKLDFDLLLEILPMVSGKPLYRKFGAFHSATKNAHEGAKSLNFSAKSTKEQVDAIVEDVADDEVINPETLEVAESHQYSYVVLNMRGLYFDPLENFKPKTAQRHKKYMPQGSSIKDALIYMLESSIGENMALKKSKIIN